MAEQILTDEWVTRLITASSELANPGHYSGVVAVAIGKKQQAVLQIVDGRVVGPGEVGAVEVTVPVTADQLGSLLDGSESLAQAYMRGDIKPVGATGPLLALVELFEDETFRKAFAATTS